MIEEQIKYVKYLIKEIKNTSHDGGNYKIWVDMPDAEALKEVLGSLNKLKKLIK